MREAGREEVRKHMMERRSCTQLEGSEGMGEVEEPFKIKIPQLQLHHTRRPRVDFVTGLWMH